MIGWVLLGIVAWYLYSSGALGAVSDSAEQAITGAQTQASEILRTIIPSVQKQDTVVTQAGVSSNLQTISVGQIIDYGGATYRVASVGGGWAGGWGFPSGETEVALTIPRGTALVDVRTGIQMVLGA